MALPAPSTTGCVWITGASSGIGAALALELVGRGYRVAASARDARDLEALAAQAPRGAIASFPLDVTNHAAVLETAAAIEAGCGTILGAVFCAGTFRPIAADGFDAMAADKQVAVNLGGVLHPLEPLLATMLARGSGHIAIVASLTSHFGLPGAGVYGATKAALVNLGEALHVECRERGVTVQVVNPGFVDTPLTARNDFPMPFLVPVGKAARIIAQGLGGDRFEIAFPWQMAWAMRLLALLPRRLAFAITRRMVRR